ncbi:MAG: DEAD/DEAH box helicase [Chlamydiae bacterium]|nr:DEAD/DEAH box helicase [Chlamydiota bacterium]
MSELIFAIEIEKKEKEAVLILNIKDRLLGSSRILYADALLKPQKEEKDLYAFLLKEHIKSLGSTSARERLATLPMTKIKIPGPQALEAIKLLALAKKLSWKDQSIYYNPFAKVEIRFLAEDRQGSLHVEGVIQIDKEDCSFKAIDLLFPGLPTWCIINRSVVGLGKLVDRNLLFKVYPGPLILEGREREKFIDLYQDDEDQSVIWKTAPTKELVSEDPTQVLPVLILSDPYGSFATLFMDYGLRGRVPFHERIGSFRNQKVEQGWEKDLLETGFQKKIVGTSHYYCPLDQVSKTISFLLELGWTIIDARGRRVCHHTSTQLQIHSDLDGIIAKGTLSYNEHLIDVQDVVGAFNRRQRFVELSPYAVGLIDPSQMERDLGDLTAADVSSQGLKLKKHQVGLLDGLLHQRHIQADFATITLLDRLKNTVDPEPAFPGSSFQGILYPYQQQGVNWLSFLYHSGLSGLLADDMGLGKTVQVLAFLSSLPVGKPCLIVAPTSLLFNWRREWEQFVPGRDVYVHSGKDRCKELSTLLGKQVILTSYAQLRIDIDLLKQISFDCVILDEAQMIKNPGSQVAESAFSLHGRMKLAITGTPVENRWDDLWSLFHYLEPELLEGRGQFHSQMMAAQVDERYLKRVKKKIKPFILRRLKEEVGLQLPEKILQTVWVEMSSSQKQIYETLVSKNRTGVLKQVEQDGAGPHRMQVLEALLRLRQVCCHPQLIDGSLSNSGELSGKLERVLSDISEIVAEGRKVLVFSQFTQMLQLLETHVRQEGWGYVYLDGSTKDRETVVSRFQEDSSTQIFLMSLKAGGVGLNLTAADYVFLIDPWWNDAAEQQAIDRAYRLGRKNVVVARRYVTAESVEEKMMKLKQHKSALAQGLIEMEGEIPTSGLQDLLLLLQ